MTLTVLWTTGQLVSRKPLSRDSSDFFKNLDWVINFWEIPKLKCHFQYLISRVYTSINMTYNFSWGPRSTGSGSICQISPLSGYSFFFFSFLPYLTLWKEIAMHRPYLEVAIMFHEKFLSSFHLFNHLYHLFVAQIILPLVSRSYSCLLLCFLWSWMYPCFSWFSWDITSSKEKKIHATTPTPTELYLLPF